jgi:hypothetical protein
MAKKRPKKRRKVEEVPTTQTDSLSLCDMSLCTQESIFCFLFPSDLARCASVSTGVQQVAETPWLWGEFITWPCTSPKIAFLGNPACAIPSYLLGDRMAMDLCLMPIQLQYDMARPNALSFLTAGVISLPEIIVLWNEMRQLFYNLLNNYFATEEWISGQVTLADLKILWSSPPGDHVVFYHRYRRHRLRI